jgi:hypothetical protein
MVEELLELLESIQWKTRAYKALAMAPTAQLTCSRPKKSIFVQKIFGEK